MGSESESVPESVSCNVNEPLGLVYTYRQHRRFSERHLWSFDVTCKQNLAAAVNPFLNGMKNGDIDSTCTRSLNEGNTEDFPTKKIMSGFLIILEGYFSNLQTSKGLLPHNRGCLCWNWPWTANSWGCWGFSSRLEPRYSWLWLLNRE